MRMILECGRIVPGCSFVARADSEEDLLLKAVEHARSVHGVYDAVASLPDIDPQRIAVAGSSTHGFVALEALRHEPRFAAGVVRAACGDYHRFLRSSSLALRRSPG